MNTLFDSLDPFHKYQPVSVTYSWHDEASILIVLKPFLYPLLNQGVLEVHVTDVTCVFKATGLRTQTLRHNRSKNRLTNKQINPWWQLGYKQTADASASKGWLANVNGWRGGWGSRGTISIQGQLEERWRTASLSLRNALWDVRGGWRQWQRSTLTEEAVMKAVLEYPSEHEVCL